MSSPRSRGVATFLGWMGPGAALLLAFATRALGFEQVFIGDGSVVFDYGDPFYHARLALFSYANFPRFLSFDTCINFPHGAASVFPPLWALSVAGLARALGGGVAGFERVAAWLPVALGALTTLPVYFVGKAVATRLVGVGAAFLYALLPVTITYSKVGNVDHHAAAGLLGALLLAGYVGVLADPREKARPWLRHAALGVARAALLLTWNGGLLYIVLGELALAIAAAQRGQRPLLAALGGGALLTAGLLAPVVWLLPTPIGGPYSAEQLSRLQPLAFSAEAALCACLLALERLRPAASPAARLLRLAGLAAGIGLLLLAVPGIFGALRGVFEFLTRSGGYTIQALEQLPLFYLGGEYSRAGGERLLGYFAHLVGFVPLAFVLRAGDAERRAALLYLFAWTLVLGYLTLQQARWAHDYAPAGCVGFALLLGQAARLLARGKARASVPLAVLLGGLMLWPTVPMFFASALRLSRAQLEGKLAGKDRALLSIAGTQTRFAQAVARATPPTPGCDTNGGDPSYGILAHPAIGHSLHYVAHRATPADPHGPFSGEENYEAVTRFLTTESEEEAIGIAERLRTPFVLTAEEGGEHPASLGQRLHREDGSASGAAPHLGRFRLLEEGPKGGVPIAWLVESERRREIPYKLFEIVPGALLVVQAAPGARVVAELPLATPSGRRFVFRAQGEADRAGLARLRVPYATDGRGPTRALAGYAISGHGLVQVSERAVREGAALAVGRGSAADGPPAGEP